MIKNAIYIVIQYISILYIQPYIVLYCNITNERHRHIPCTTYTIQNTFTYLIVAFEVVLVAVVVTVVD